MNRRDVAINGVLLVLILAAGYCVGKYRPVEVKPPNERLPESRGVEQIETTGPRPVMLVTQHQDIDRIAEKSRLVTYNPFATIIPAPPPPPPPVPTPEPPPRLAAVMAQFEPSMVDTSRGRFTLQEKSGGAEIQWRVGETKELLYRGKKISVTLERLDPNDFSAKLTAPDDQVHVYTYFE